jgi:hypothetical protein
VNGDGSVTQVADLSSFLKANPVASPEEDDFEPDGPWYSMVAVHGDSVRRRAEPIYVSSIGFGPPPVGLGQVLRIEISS